MLSLQSHHITDLYVIVDDMLPKEKRPNGGRPQLMTDSELITALVWNSLSVHSKTIKDIHEWLRLYHGRDFKHMPKYAGFVAKCQRIIPLLIYVINNLLLNEPPIRFMDSTMLPVCKLQRASDHKVTKGIAQFGKNHQGWHYGFKLHASIDHKGRLSGLCLSPANTHDTRAIPFLTDKQTKVAVGDGGYNAKAMRDHIYERYGTLVIAPPHPKQNKRLMTKWQQILLNMRSKIECTFDYLKNHLGLVTSFPRSTKGYLFHWLRIILGYQVMTI